jgi:hypothetical protein
MTGAVDTTPQWTADPTGGYAFHGFAIVPSDTADLPYVVNKIYVGVSGSITVTFDDDTSSVQLVNVANGVLRDFRIRRVWATGTTATNLIGAY